MKTETQKKPQNRAPKAPQKTTPKAQQNGATNAPKNGEAKPEEKEVLEIAKFLTPSAEDRIKRAQNFQILASKHEHLTKKAQELEQFMMSSDGTKEQVILKNSQGFEFVASNTQVIEEVLIVVRGKLTAFLNKSEKEILEYTI